MALQHISLLPADGLMVEFRAVELEADRILTDFGTIPSPEKQTYTIVVGNPTDGFMDGTLVIDWENSEWVMVMMFTATEQPPG
jgi:hypothetical protein